MTALLPSSGLATLHVADHQAHHEALHATHSLWHFFGEQGWIHMKDLGEIWRVRPVDYVTDGMANHITHNAVGVVDLGMKHATRAIQIDAGADITGFDPTIAPLANPINETKYKAVAVRIFATADIDIAYGGITPIGATTFTLAANTATYFEMQFWNVSPL